MQKEKGSGIVGEGVLSPLLTAAWTNWRPNVQPYLDLAATPHPRYSWSQSSEGYEMGVEMAAWPRLTGHDSSANFAYAEMAPWGTH